MQKLPEPKRRIVLKKGRLLTTRDPKFVLKLSKQIYKRLKPLSRRIEIAGSIRRKVPKPYDVDIVLIPKDKDRVSEALHNLGKFKSGGGHRLTYRIEGVSVEIYFAEAKSWGAMMLTYTGSFGNNIGLRVIAKKKGMLLNQYGLFKEDELIASKTENAIYKAMGRSYTPPEGRK